MKPESTICWRCKNALGGCSWSKNFKPVKGWEAVATKIDSNYKNGIESYKVITCPEYRKG